MKFLKSITEAAAVIAVPKVGNAMIVFHKNPADGKFGQFRVSKITSTLIVGRDLATDELMKFNAKTGLGQGEHGQLLIKLPQLTEIFADQGSGHSPKDSVKRKFIVTVKQADGTEIEKNVKAYSIADIEHHFGNKFVQAERHPDDPEEDDENEDDDRTADEVEADEADELEEAIIAEALLGSRIDFDVYSNWKKALPPKHTMHQDGTIERAQSRGKDFEGVAGTWDSAKKSGWIYAYYLKKDNLVEAQDWGYRAVLAKFGFKQKTPGTYRNTAPGAGTICIDPRHGHWTHNDVGTTDATTDYEGTTVNTLERHLKSRLGNLAEGLMQLAKMAKSPSESLIPLTEMAKRTKADEFYAMAKKKFGAEKVKSLKWPEIKAIADENDVLIPPYLRTQKVGRGLFNLVPPEHADAKSPPAAAPKAEAPKEAPKAEEKKYNYPQLMNVSYTEWSEFYRELKKIYGDFEIMRVPYGTQYRGRFGGQIGEKLIIDKKSDKVIGVWEVTGEDKVPGRGMVSYGRGYIAKEKQEAPKAKPVEAARRKGGNATADEMKTALLDVASEMKYHKSGRGADWRTTPEKDYNGFCIEVRYWGEWEGDDGSGDFDFQELSNTSAKEVAKILNQAEQRHKTVALSFSTGEKNWITIHAK